MEVCYESSEFVKKKLSSSTVSGAKVGMGGLYGEGRIGESLDWDIESKEWLDG